MDDRSTRARSRTVVVIAVFLSAVFLQIVKGVVIAVAVESPTGAMPVVGAGLGHDIELAARGMSVFCGKLIGQESELRHRLLNYGLGGAVGVDLVVVHAVDRKSVKARPCTAD